MKALIEGDIENFVPFFNGYVSEDGILIFGGDEEFSRFSFTVDTGFSGGIALSKEVLKKMKVKLIDYGIFRLATGDEVELPVFWGKVIVKDYKIETWFVPGDLLLGMEFLSLAGSKLSFDFENKEVKLMERKRHG